MKQRLVIGTRGSKLALWQAAHVAECIRSSHPDVDVVLKHIVTTGDRILDVPLAKIGGKGLFTKELEKELLAGDIDLAVHSLKDMPTDLPEGLTIGAISRRIDPGDALISPQYGKIDNLPKGARIGTSSLRRKAQLLNYRPDLLISDLRGNLDTRLAKLASERLDAIVLAASGLRRLGWEDKISEIIDYEICLPAVGQGALAVETRAADPAVLERLACLHHPETATAVAAERSFLRVLEGGCQVPIGVYARIEEEQLVLDAVMLSPDGTRKLRDRIAGAPADAQRLGRHLAHEMYRAGGKEVLAGILGDSWNGGHVH